MIFVWIFLIFVAVLIAIGIIKKVLKVVLIIVFVFVILFLVTSGGILNDFNAIKEKVSDSAALVLLEDNGKIAYGFTDDKEIKFLTDDELTAVNKNYIDKEFSKIKGNNYKLFIVKYPVFEDIDSIMVNNKEIGYADINELYRYDTPILSLTYEDLILDTKIEQADFKHALFAYVYTHNIKLSRSPVFFFKEYKKGNIIVYPETAFFKFAKLIPLVMDRGKS
jgi:hypothetical protein